MKSLSLFETFARLKRNQSAKICDLCGREITCTHGGRVPHTSTFLTFWHVLHHRSTSLRLLNEVRFSAPLCSCSGASREGQQKSRRPHGTSGPARWNGMFPDSALSLAPRCCPFPVSSTVTVVNLRHFRSASPTIAHSTRARKQARSRFRLTSRLFLAHLAVAEPA